MKFVRILLLLGVILATTFCSKDSRFYSNQLRSDVFVQIHDVDQYDFLWVLDNSQSMEDRRTYVKDNMQGFLNTLQSRKAIDFQMAVVTTDYFNEKGALVESTGGARVIKSLASLNPAAEFAAILENVKDHPTTSFWEQGLESAYQAIQKYGTEFMREDVPLIMIILTDEDDYSCKSSCYGVEPENNTNWVAHTTERYIDYFNSLGENRVSVFPIVGTTESICSIPSLGYRYLEVSEESEGFGVGGSICLEQLPDSYENIARIIADRGIRFHLGNQASGKGIRVFVDQKEVPWSEDDGFIFDDSDNSIVFSGSWIPNNQSVIEVLYSELTT